MFEPLTDSVSVCVSRAHTFGSDGLLLAGAARRMAPEAETLCDLGTGCGIVPLALYAMGCRAAVTGIDIMPEAIDQFREGIRVSHAQNLTAVCGDLRDPSSLPSDSFDAVTANPPYFRMGHGILPSDPARAAARYEVYCTPKDLCSTARRITKAGGKLTVCYPPARLPHILKAMEEEGFTPRSLQFVQQDGESAPWLFLLMGQKGVGEELTLLPPILRRPNDPYEEVLTL